jgi:hypothetical protein
MGRHSEAFLIADIFVKRSPLTMNACRTPEPPVDRSVEQSFVSAVFSGRADAMKYFFDRIPMPPRQLPRSHLFNHASPRVTICWRPTRGDFILCSIADDSRAGAWRISFDSDVLGYAFDEHVSWEREPTSDELAFSAVPASFFEAHAEALGFCLVQATSLSTGQALITRSGSIQARSAFNAA